MSLHFHGIDAKDFLEAVLDGTRSQAEWPAFYNYVTKRFFKNEDDVPCGWSPRYVEEKIKNFNKVLFMNDKKKIDYPKRHKPSTYVTVLEEAGLL